MSCLALTVTLLSLWLSFTHCGSNLLFVLCAWAEYLLCLFAYLSMEFVPCYIRLSEKWLYHQGSRFCKPTSLTHVSPVNTLCICISSRNKPACLFSPIINHTPSQSVSLHNDYLVRINHLQSRTKTYHSTYQVTIVLRRLMFRSLSQLHISYIVKKQLGLRTLSHS